MAATKRSAEVFIRQVTEAAAKARTDLGLERDDIDLRISVTIQSRVTYDEHEDEN